MKLGNVLVIGNSGVGKSTLINAVLGENRALTGGGIEGTTKDLEIYESEDIPFRIIDTIGFEPSLVKEFKAINAVKKWSKKSAKAGSEDTQINVIWFCVDGTSKKLFANTIKDLSRAVSMWESVPIVVVITKSYSVPEREENIEMVNNAFARQKKYAGNLKKVIPVVADTFVLNETAYAPPEGITELIEVTNQLLPEGVQAADRDVKQFVLDRKRAMAQGVTAIATTAGVVVGAIPIPFPDGLILAPTEVGEINAIAKIYGIKNDEDSKRLLNSIVEVGTVGAAAKGAIQAIKAIPGLNIGASVLNAIIAGAIVASLGEGSIYIFEKIYLGEKSVKDIDWVTKVLNSQFASKLLEKVQMVFNESGEKDIKAIGKKIVEIFLSGNKRLK